MDVMTVKHIPCFTKNLFARHFTILILSTSENGRQQDRGRAIAKNKMKMCEASVAHLDSLRSHIWDISACLYVSKEVTKIIHNVTTGCWVTARSRIIRT
jgi:hypothetical protein